MGILDEIQAKVEQVAKDIKKWKAKKDADDLEEMSMEIYKLHGEISTASKEGDTMRMEIETSVKELAKLAGDEAKFFDKPEVALKKAETIKKDIEAYIKKLKDNDKIVDEWSKKHDKYDKLKAKYEKDNG